MHSSRKIRSVRHPDAFLVQLGTVSHRIQRNDKHNIKYPPQIKTNYMQLWFFQSSDDMNTSSV